MARDFDGVNDKIRTTNSIDLAATGAVSLGIWMKNNATNSAFDTLIGEISSGGTGFSTLDMAGVGANFVRMTTNSGGATREALSVTVANDDIWHYVFGEFQDGGSGFIRVYIDDMDTASASNSGSFGTMNALNDSVEIGNGTNFSRFFEGQLFRGQCWTRILTASERKQAKFGLLLGDSNHPVFIPIDGNLSPEPNYADPANTGTLTGTTKPNTNPPVELLENFL